MPQEGRGEPNSGAVVPASPQAERCSSPLGCAEPVVRIPPRSLQSQLTGYTPGGVGDAQAGPADPPEGDPATATTEEGTVPVIQRLLLSNLTFLPSGTSPGKGLRLGNIVSLNLSGCSLSTLCPSVLSQTPLIEFLSLRSNRISDVSGVIGTPCAPFLWVVDCSFNEIESMEFLSKPGIRYGCHGSVDLRGNPLRKAELRHIVRLACIELNVTFSDETEGFLRSTQQGSSATTPPHTTAGQFTLQGYNLAANPQDIFRIGPGCFSRQGESMDYCDPAEAAAEGLAGPTGRRRGGVGVVVPAGAGVSAESSGVVWKGFATAGGGSATQSAPPDAVTPENTFLVVNGVVRGVSAPLKVNTRCILRRLHRNHERGHRFFSKYTTLLQEGGTPASRCRQRSGANPADAMPFVSPLLAPGGDPAVLTLLVQFYLELFQQRVLVSCGPHYFDDPLRRAAAAQVSLRSNPLLRLKRCVLTSPVSNIGVNGAQFYLTRTLLDEILRLPKEVEVAPPPHTTSATATAAHPPAAGTPTGAGGVQPDDPTNKAYRAALQELVGQAPFFWGLWGASPEVARQAATLLQADREYRLPEALLSKLLGMVVSAGLDAACDGGEAGHPGGISPSIRAAFVGECVSRLRGAAKELLICIVVAAAGGGSAAARVGRPLRSFFPPVGVGSEAGVNPFARLSQFAAFNFYFVLLDSKLRFFQAAEEIPHGGDAGMPLDCTPGLKETFKLIPQDLLRDALEEKIAVTSTQASAKQTEAQASCVAAAAEESHAMAWRVLSRAQRGSMVQTSPDDSVFNLCIHEMVRERQQQYSTGEIHDLRHAPPPQRAARSAATHHRIRQPFHAFRGGAEAEAVAALYANKELRCLREAEGPGTPDSPEEAAGRTLRLQPPPPPGEPSPMAVVSQAAAVVPRGGPAGAKAAGVPPPAPQAEGVREASASCCPAAKRGADEVRRGLQAERCPGTPLSVLANPAAGGARLVQRNLLIRAHRLQQQRERERERERERAAVEREQQAEQRSDSHGHAAPQAERQQGGAGADTASLPCGDSQDEEEGVAAAEAGPSRVLQVVSQSAPLLSAHKGQGLRDSMQRYATAIRPAAAAGGGTTKTGVDFFRRKNHPVVRRKPLEPTPLQDPSFVEAPPTPASPEIGDTVHHAGFPHPLRVVRIVGDVVGVAAPPPPPGGSGSGSGSAAPAARDACGRLVFGAAPTSPPGEGADSSAEGAAADPFVHKMPLGLLQFFHGRGWVLPRPSRPVAGDAVHMGGWRYSVAGDAGGGTVRLRAQQGGSMAAGGEGEGEGGGEVEAASGTAVVRVADLVWGVTQQGHLWTHAANACQVDFNTMRPTSCPGRVDAVPLRQTSAGLRQVSEAGGSVGCVGGAVSSQQSSADAMHRLLANTSELAASLAPSWSALEKGRHTFVVKDPASPWHPFTEASLKRMTLRRQRLELKEKLMRDGAEVEVAAGPLDCSGSLSGARVGFANASTKQFMPSTVRAQLAEVERPGRPPSAPVASAVQGAGGGPALGHSAQSGGLGSASKTAPPKFLCGSRARPASAALPPRPLSSQPAQTPLAVSPATAYATAKSVIALAASTISEAEGNIACILEAALPRPVGCERASLFRTGF